MSGKLKGNSCERSERKIYKESVNFFGEYLSNTEQNIDRNMDGIGYSDEVSDKNDEHVIGQ